MRACIAQITVDAVDVAMIARFWSAALGMQVDMGTDGAAKLYPPTDGRASLPPIIWVQRSHQPKTTKLRLHLDLRPLYGRVEAEIHRLLDLGAKRVDIGQSGHEGFTVLADPEGNEFCVLHEDPCRPPHSDRLEPEALDINGPPDQEAAPRPS